MTWFQTAERCITPKRLSASCGQKRIWPRSLGFLPKRMVHELHPINVKVILFTILSFSALTKFHSSNSGRSITSGRSMTMTVYELSLFCVGLPHGMLTRSWIVMHSTVGEKHDVILKFLLTRVLCWMTSHLHAQQSSFQWRCQQQRNNSSFGCSKTKDVIFMK